MDDLLRGTADLVLDLQGWDSDKRAGDFHDSLVMACITRILQPKLYWEIGTGDGRTALLVARNTPAESSVYTLDPGYPTDPKKGQIFRGLPEAAKIKQFGDYSNRFDFGPWLGRTDLVFVDGSHDYESVLSDCELAFRLTSPSGWVLWHDAAMDTPGVPKALKNCPRSNQIEMIAETRYALYRPRAAKRG